MDSQESLPLILQESLEIKSMRPGLERMLIIDRLLDFPSRRFASIHVAGTNGKGSVTTKIAHAFQAQGKKVGLYTSPHISTYHERIQINGQQISEEAADRILKKICQSKETLCSDFHLSYFEFLTLLAFSYFAEEQVEFALIETGMGGRFDATNIVLPILSVITSIDFDHMAYLGESLEAIASEKAGIIKAGVPVLLGPEARPYTVFEEEAKKVHSPLFQLKGSFIHYEEENRAIAQKALSLLPFVLEPSCIEIGLSTIPPCRFERVCEHPTIILDVAHNPNGLKRLFERLDLVYPGKKVRLLAGFSADKAIDEALEILKHKGSALHLVHTEHFRLAKLGAPLESVFETAYHQAKKNQEIILICGSFFLMHQAKILTKLMRAQEGD